MKKTKKAYTQYLNDLYRDIYTLEEFVNNFCYFKHGKMKTGHLVNMYFKRKGGEGVRKYDPIGFEVGYKDWCTE